MKRVFVLLVACASLLACESLALGQELQVGSPLRKSIAPGETPLQRERASRSENSCLGRTARDRAS